jgi:hypothetical protein
MPSPSTGFITLPIKANPIRFYPQLDTTPNKYNSRSFDQVSFADSLLPGQTAKPYEQKATFADWITIMVHTQYNTITLPGEIWPYLSILDHNFKVLSGGSSTSSPGDVNSVPYYKGLQGYDTGLINNVYTDPLTGAVTNMDVSLWSFRFGDFFNPTTDSGEYYLQMTTRNDDGDVDIWLSEPIFLFAEQPNTILLQYTDDTNNIYHKNIIDGWYMGYIPYFEIRVEGRLLPFDIKSLFIGYEQQDYDRLQMNAKNARIWKFDLGGNTQGVPNYIYEKVAEAFTFDNKAIDGKLYQVDTDNENLAQVWKKRDSDTSPLIWAELPIRERFNSENVIVSNSVVMLRSLWKTEGSGVFLPYAWVAFTLSDGITTITIPPATIYATTDETLELNILNTTVAALYGLTGAFTLSADGYWIYNNGASENFTLVSAPVILDTLLELTIAPYASPPGVYSWQYTYAGLSSYQIIDKNRSSTLTTLHPADGLNHTFSTTLTGGTNTVQIFHNNVNFTRFYLNYSGVLKINAIAGNAPSSLAQLTIQDQNLVTATAPIALCAALTNFTYVNNLTTSFSPALFTSGNNPNLIGIFIYQNKLTATEVDKLFNNYVNNLASIISSGTFETDLNTPIAPPTGASAAARATLTGLGWAIYTD